MYAVRRAFQGLRSIRNVTSGTRFFASDVSLHTNMHRYVTPPSLVPVDGVQFGGDVPVVIHQSLREMIPVDFTSLSGRLFNAPVRVDLVHRVVHWQLARRRAGTAKTKHRSEVNASGRKVRPQKGTGRSRQGARSSPIFRGGGVVHGPVPRNYDYPLPKNVRRFAIRSMLTSKYQCGQLWIVQSAAFPSEKTADVVDTFRKLKWRSALVVDHVPDAIAGVDPSLLRASHNVAPVLAVNARGLNVYDALYFDMLVLTTAALNSITSRFEPYHQFV